MMTDEKSKELIKITQPHRRVRPCHYSMIIIFIFIAHKMMILRRNAWKFCDLTSKNKKFIDKVKGYKKQFNLHEKARDITPEQKDKFILETPDDKIAESIYKESKFDKEVKSYIEKFNEQNKGKINLLDFSHYTTDFNDLKDMKLTKEDMGLLQEFQKRKVDHRMRLLNRTSATRLDGNLKGYKRKVGYSMYKTGELHYSYLAPRYYKKMEHRRPGGKVEEKERENKGRSKRKAKTGRENHYSWNRFMSERNDRSGPDTSGVFQIHSQFIMILLNKSTTTKITTLNRINFFRVLLFMANGNGIISHGKSRALKAEDAMSRAVADCKRNLIAIPMDPRCTVPRAIEKRFQDYHIYLRPLAGFNPWGHPVFALLLSITGFKHIGFKTVHTGKNMYTLLASFFKAVTKNTTPQELAEMYGFKVYRHRFVRPLTEERTHFKLSK